MPPWPGCRLCSEFNTMHENRMAAKYGDAPAPAKKAAPARGGGGKSTKTRRRGA